MSRQVSEQVIRHRIASKIPGYSEASLSVSEAPRTIFLAWVKWVTFHYQQQAASLQISMTQ